MYKTEEEFRSFYTPEWIAMKVRELSHISAIDMISTSVSNALISLHYEFTKEPVEDIDVPYAPFTTLGEDDAIFILRSIYDFLREVTYHYSSDIHITILDRIEDAVSELYTVITRSSIRFFA